MPFWMITKVETMALARVDFFSCALMRTVTMNAIVPADYAEISAGGRAVTRDVHEQQSFKTLYLLHGVYGNYTDWVTRTRIQELAEARNLTVIMPSGDNGFYNDHADGSRYGEFIGQELVSFSRKLFCLSDRREDTFIGGLSMGGYGAIVNALRNPETFDSVIALSSGLVGSRLDDLSDRDDIGILESRAFHEACLGPREHFAGSKNDYDALAARVADAGGVRPRFFMACGTEDSLLPANQTFRDHLRECGYDLEYHEGPGAHNWRFWDTWIEQALDWLPLDHAQAPISSGNVR